MKYLNKKVRLDYICFFLSWFIYIFRTACPKICDLIPNSNILTGIQFLLLFVCIMLKRYTYKQLLLIFLLEIALIISYLKSDNYQMILLFSNIFAFKDLEFKKALKFDISFKTIFLLLNFICIFLGVIDNSFSYRNGNFRYDFGFYNPNTFASIVTSIVIEILYIRNMKNEKRKFDFLIPIITSVILAHFCQSRGSSYILILLAVLMLFKKIDIYKKILIFMPTTLTIISFKLISLFNQGNAIALRVNELLSTRLFCASNYLNNYQINLLGNNIIKYEKWIGYVQTIDIAYIASPLINGILIFALFIIIFTIFLWNIVKTNNRMIIKVMFIMCIYGLVEKNAFILSSNIFLLLISEYVLEKKLNENKNSE